MAHPFKNIPHTKIYTLLTTHKMEVQLTNGTATIKEVFPRWLKKKVNEIMFEGVEVSGVEKISGFSIPNKDKADDAVVLGMLEKLVIDEKDQEINQKTLDNMPSEDFDKLVAEINKVTAKKGLKG